MEAVIMAQVAKSVMDSVVIPLLKSFATLLKTKYKVSVQDTEKHFLRYFSRAYEKLSVMNTLALKNEQLRLQDIYQPLTLYSDARQKPEKYLLDKFPYGLLDEYGKILINDTAGMGKSTLSKFLFIKLIDDGIRIPLFIELRKLTKRHTVVDEIMALLNGIEEIVDKKFVTALLKKGGFCFIFDGFDEISTSNRNAVTEDLKTFIDDLSDGNFFILTSRPEGILSSFGDFKKLEIQPLKEREAFSLLRRYDNNGETSNKLIQELKSKRNDSVKEFLRNPLLVSLLFIVYDHKAMIPLKKHLFYSQVYDALFESHDLSKGAQNIRVRECGLDKDDFDKMLRFIGFEAVRSNDIQYTKERLIKVISEAKRFWPSLQVKDSDFLKDLITAVPLFIRDGVEYKWAHKSLSEYFAAKFIYLDSKDGGDSILNKILSSNQLPNYINMLDLYYDLDVAGFKKNILLPILRQYKAYLEQFDEDSPVFFLRNLCFLKKGEVRVFDLQNFGEEGMGVNSMAENESVRYTFVPLIFTDLKTGYLYLERNLPGEYGRRLILEKMHEKKVHHVENYETSPIEATWVGSLETGKSFDMETLISLAGDDAEKLGELCEIIGELGDESSVYMDKDNIDIEIEAIEREMEAQSFEFDL